MILCNPFFFFFFPPNSVFWTYVYLYPDLFFTVSVRSYFVNRDVKYRLTFQFFFSLVGLSAKYPLPKGSSFCSLLAPSLLLPHSLFISLICLFVAVAAAEKSDLLTMMQCIDFYRVAMHAQSHSLEQKHKNITFFTHVHTHLQLLVKGQPTDAKEKVYYCVIYCARKWPVACFL